MGSGKLFTLRYIPSLQDSEESVSRLTEEGDSGTRILGLCLLLALLTFCYGLVMGSYHSPAQALAAGIKVTILFFAALLICFPALFIIQYILGSRLKLSQILSIVLSGLVLTSAIMVSFAPIVIIFLLTGSDYYFLQLLHITVFVLSGIFGMMSVVQSLRYACEKKNVYPHTGVVVFRFWAVILAFVGIQLAWNLRPFLGDRGEPFEWVRDYDGNFYTALIYSVRQLTGSEENEPKFRQTPARTTTPADSIPPANIFEGG